MEKVISIIGIILDVLVPLIITTLFGVFMAKMKKMSETYDAGKQAIAKAAADAAKEEIISHTSEEDKKLQEQINNTQVYMNKIVVGLLSVQGRQFKKHCRELLEPNHVITFDEYQEIISDHDAYNGLGGNHLGDMLFDSVVKKYNAQTTQN